MRLSNIQILLFHFFLFNFLTLFLNLNASAQAVSFASNLTYHDYRQNRLSLNRTTDNFTYNEGDTAESDGEIIGGEHLPAFDFRHTSEAYHTQLSAYHVLRNNSKYPMHNLLARVY